MLLAIAGKPGSGKSAVARRLADSLNLELMSFGALFRDKAQEMSLSLDELGDYAESHEEVDLELDREQLNYIKRGGCIIDSRLGGYMAWREEIPSVKIYLKACLEVRAQRVANREDIKIDVAKDEIEKRDASEKRRYHNLYSIDIDDLSPYDLVINSELLAEIGVFEVSKTFCEFHLSP